MNSHERGRSPSAGQANHLRTAASASPHPPFDASFASADNNLNSTAYSNVGAQTGQGAFNDFSFTQDSQQQVNYFLGPTYTDFQEQEQKLPQAPTVPSQGGDITNHTFLHSSQDFPVQGNTGTFDFTHGGQGSNHVSPSALSQNNSPSGASNPDAFPSFDFNQTSFDQNSAVDPSILTDIDPSSIDLLPQQDNTSGILDPMAAAMQSHSPTPPHLLPDMARAQSNSPSPNASPSFQQANFASFNRPRNTSESLDPSSAMFPQGQNEWTNMGAYRGHRRTPSDNHSDYSSHSNQASPYMPTLDNFDAHSSPLLDPTQDSAFNEALGMQQFSLNEQQQPTQQTYLHHSQQASPHIGPQPQQALPPFSAENNFGLNASMGGQFNQQQNGLEMFPGVGQEPFPSMNQQSPGDMGHADQMSPPEISIEYAPPSKPMENARPGNDEEALSPPMRCKSYPLSRRIPRYVANSRKAQSRNRMRAKSDSYAGSRPSSPSVQGRGRSPSLQPQMSTGDTLFPFDSTNAPSRSPSPARGRNGSLGRARSSSNASDRDYLLDLANPERSPSTGGEKSGRVQKHPATFQCSLCPKRFTRAYNLRSHLRTHTDERPFVCTVCGKAFARQHDRKRHEGLHSGEKKFVCKGTLQSGAHWGCGRRFARADALGRHFRSEAGRVCIKPLLDEEAAERQRVEMERQQQVNVAAGLAAPPPPIMDMMALPQALYQQYPALAGIDWNSVPQGGPEEDYSGRSSFDASSGGEYYDEMSENEMGSYQDPAQMTSLSNNMGMQQGMGVSMQSGAQGYSVYGNQTGDYLNEFEGR